MNHVHPIFSPIVEQIANQHFVAAVDRVFGILDTPAEPVDDDRPECEDCGEKIDGEVEYIDVNCYRARCESCWQEVYGKKEADRQEREDMRSFGSYQYRQSGTSPY